MSTSSIFEFLEDIIRLDYYNFQEIRKDFEKDQDYSSVSDEIIRFEVYDGRSDEYLTLDTPQHITFESFLKRELNSELDSVFRKIEEENKRSIPPIENILFLNTCLAKADILQMRAQNIGNDYTKIVVDTLSTFSNQLHQRFDKELELKSDTYKSASGKSQSELLLELQRMNERETSMKTAKDTNPKLKFDLNRNQITVLFLLLAQNGGLNRDTSPADIAKFLEKNCLFWNEKKKEYSAVTDVAPLISDFKNWEKKTATPVKWIKGFFRDAEIRF